jgi:hypothetical protein
MSESCSSTLSEHEAGHSVTCTLRQLHVVRVPAKSVQPTLRFNVFHRYSGRLALFGVRFSLFGVSVSLLFAVV